MKVNRYKVKFGGIVAYLYIPESNKPHKAIIFAYGMPGQPMSGSGTIAHKFARRGFFTICPHYIGTFDSKGIYTFENAVNTLLETIRFLKKGKIKLPWDDNPITWKVKNISLIGGSFGASVVLVAGAKSKDVKKIIAIATPTDYRDAGKRFEGEETIEFDYRVMNYCWTGTWRSTAIHWKKFIKGDVDLNAVDYVRQLKNKNVLLMHGKLDKDVNVRRSIELYKKIRSDKGKSKLILLPKSGHLGVNILNRRTLFNDTLKWLREAEL